jgi:hypothetical protein
MAPDFEQPDFPDRFDIVFALDMIHFLNDHELDLMLKRIRNRLDDGHRLILRNVVKSASESWHVKLYRWGGVFTATFMRFRTAEQIVQHVKTAGFDLAETRICGTNRELIWFAAVASPVTGSVKMVEHPDTGNGQNNNHVQHDDPQPIHGGELVKLLQRTQST